MLHGLTNTKGLALHAIWGQGVEVVNVPLVRCQARGYAP